MKHLILALSLTACAAAAPEDDALTSTSQQLCTIEDQQAGLCSGPFDTEQNYTEGYAADQVGTSDLTAFCWRSCGAITCSVDCQVIWGVYIIGCNFSPLAGVNCYANFGG